MAQDRFFANTCFETESGDIAGFVVERIDGTPPTMRFFRSEGSLVTSAEAKVTRDDPDGAVAFTVLASGLAPGIRNEPPQIFHFTGRQNTNTLAGTIDPPWQTTPIPVVLELRSRSEALDPQDRIGTGFCAPRSHPSPQRSRSR